MYTYTDTRLEDKNDERIGSNSMIQNETSLHGPQTRPSPHIHTHSEREASRMGGGKRRQGPPVQSIVSQHHTSVLHIFVFSCRSVYILRDAGMAYGAWTRAKGANGSVGLCISYNGGVHSDREVTKGRRGGDQQGHARVAEKPFLPSRVAHFHDPPGTRTRATGTIHSQPCTCAASLRPP